MGTVSGARVTLREVAHASGVSQSTASFVLNNTPRQTISPDTQARVRRAAQELGYVPHGIARALSEGSSRIVILNVDNAAESHYSRSFIRGLDQELAAHDHVLLVRHDHASEADEKQVLAAIAPRAVLRFAEAYRNGYELQDSGDGWRDGLAAHVLLQLRYLAERGHTRIGLTLPDGEVPLARVRRRFALEVVEILGLEPLATFSVPRDRPLAAEALLDFRRRQPRVTAAACFDDETALRLLTAMRDVDLSAPTDLAVIGFDENDYASLSDPALTTILTDGESHGRIAARRALGLDTADIQTVLAQIVRRDSA